MSFSECAAVYVQRQGSGPGIISFDDFGKTDGEQDDAVTSRFAASLAEWARVKA